MPLFEITSFCGFPGYKPVPPDWFKINVGFITGTPKVGFMEKPGIEPATPGLQGIALIHYTTAASCLQSRLGCLIIVYIILYIRI